MIASHTDFQLILKQFEYQHEPPFVSDLYGVFSAHILQEQSQGTGILQGVNGGVMPQAKRERVGSYLFCKAQDWALAVGGGAYDFTSGESCSLPGVSSSP